MLRLATSSNGPVIAPQRIAIWGLEPELANYIDRRLRAHWPGLTVQHITAGEPIGLQAQDICICGAEPFPPLCVPTLWLGEIDRSRGMVRISESLWKRGLPLTGRQLLRCVEEMQRSGRHAHDPPAPGGASLEQQGSK